jgi:hypothetical protein
LSGLTASVRVAGSARVRGIGHQGVRFRKRWHADDAEKTAD